jgi:hypothetical protein
MFRRADWDFNRRPVIRESTFAITAPVSASTVTEHIAIALPPNRSNEMPTIEQCRTYAGEYKILGKDQQISARRSSVLLSISRSWTALAHQLESLTVIDKDEGK